MTKQKSVESRWQTVPETTDVPVMARLPAVAPVERRNMAARYALLRRIFREFGDMPGLSVTPNQAATLFGLSPEVALRILREGWPDDESSSPATIMLAKLPRALPQPSAVGLEVAWPEAPSLLLRATLIAFDARRRNATSGLV